jgi:hypothetical protein
MTMHDDGPDNTDRADWASLALNAHYSATHNDEDLPESTEDEADREEMQTALQDLLCDLRHFAGQSGLDFDLASENGEFHYTVELAEEAEEVGS